MSPETQKALRDLEAKHDRAVLRLHLKLRRYDDAQAQRLEAVEKRLGLPSPPRRSHQ